MVRNDKLISVIIPVYDGERYLGDAIESVLAQDHRPIEVIVVNDGSTDNTETIVQRYGNDILYARQENRGPAAARNRGLQMSHGKFIAFLDADDLWSKNKLSLQLTRLTEDHTSEIVVGLSQVMKLHDGGDKPTFRKWHDPILLLLFGAALIRRSVFEKVGFFDETLPHSEDTDWFMRVMERGISMVIIQEPTLFYRQHEWNMTLDREARNKHFVIALKRSIDRRRQSGGGQVAPFPKLADFEKVMRNLRDPIESDERESD